ncbi:LLM class flavin-dependent oxidoreductase [Amycolatopsis sp. DSM 110486]|uniref:LLM class flavin-dependent oxidoreductase n=1 Tax=Amycolatopsis sp. DSM 110486 TaxID=2865832 RepID=UPI001C69B181|nr:LLM class flavin-dependent oxidoreductase [Amycolatopsis sp. DSM 110486]QYN23252.1 LLM class flavin-dependent oxidoreductase [Amycolatopsis sp. DSM 110486]
MRFQLLDILPHLQNPVTGRIVSTSDRYAQALNTAQRAEQIGFDAVALGERHAGPFLSAGVTVLLGAIAATTSRVRIQTGVTVLSISDPVRIAEDFATIDQLSRGRVEIVIGKGNEARQLPMFGVEPGQQWDQLAEKYELLRRLWREENVTWEGKFRGALDGVTTLPRPFAGAPRVWHGSATTLTSAELAAKWGDPLFSANAIQPRDNYKILIDHYRAEYDRHGHDPRYAFVGAGAGFLYLADSTQDAREHFGPVYEKMVEFFNKPGNHTPGNEMVFRDIDHAIAEGPVLVGSPQQIIDKILYFHAAFGHDLQSFSLPTMLPHEQQLEMLERFAAEVIPVVRKEAPTTLWTDADPYGARPAFAGKQVPDAAALIDGR